MNVVTSFSPSGYEVYGKQFLKSFLTNWPDCVQLHVFLEHQPIPFDNPRVTWHDLHLDHDHESFCAKYSGPEFNHKTDFNAQSVRFCHKVFAITSPELPSKGERVWCDADVVTNRRITQADVDAMFPSGKALAYLGRDPKLNKQVWVFNGIERKICTESGFIYYNLDHPKVLPLLAEMRRFYTSGELFSRPATDWHDAKVFDICRDRAGFEDYELLNYCDGIVGTHPWPHTVLGRCMTHNKGPGRKASAYR